MNRLMIEDIETECGIEFHPHACSFPLMVGEQFDALVSDIQQNGLLESIVMLDGKVLDGRNRYRAMKLLDPLFSLETAPKLFTRFVGDDPLEWVVSKNLHRRHLSVSQRAVIAARLSLATPGRNRWKPGISSPTAGRLLNVSTGSVNEAKRLIKNRPEVVPSIEAGSQRVGRRDKDCSIIHASIPIADAVAFRKLCVRNKTSMATALHSLIRKALGLAPVTSKPKPSGGRALRTSVA